MQAEHCSRGDSDAPFETSNYKITTTPAREWKITMQRDKQLADMRHGRRLPDVKKLLRSDEATKAGLCLAEVVALVLYTGPMVSRARTPAVARPRWPAHIALLE